MALQMGIVGLPNVGKSTLFNALTRSRGAQTANYPFCTIDPNVGIVEVPDERLAKLAEIEKPERVIPTAIEFVDIAGLVRGASRGEGLGNAFLSHIREVDAICHVIRAFSGTDVIHVEGNANPKRDREIIEAELIIADLERVQKRIDKVQGGARTGNEEQKKELAVLEKIAAALKEGKFARTVSVDEKEELYAAAMQLLTTKPMIYALNISEEELGKMDLKGAKEQAGLSDRDIAILIAAKLEEEVITVSPEEGRSLLRELGVESSGLDQLITAAYEALRFITFLTAGPKEVRAWTVRRGAKAPEAAGAIHTDFEKGFIRVETISYNDFIQLGGEGKAKIAGKMRVEGKEYVVQDGDVMHFRV